MKRVSGTLAGALLLGRAGASSVAHNWSLALISLVAAFGVWFFVQDVEDPRIQAVVPAEGSQFIRVEVVNLPDGFIVADLAPVRVEVEARESDIEGLNSGDFRATVDVHALFPGNSFPADGETSSLPITVESRRDGVRLLNVLPPSVQVSVVRAESKELPVTVRFTGSPPEGFVLTGDPVIEPSFVRVTGLPQLVQSVASVEVDIPLGGFKDETVNIDADIVARTEAGNAVSATLSPKRVRVTLKLEEVFTLQTLPLVPVVGGFPAPGFRIASVVVDPPAVTVSGLRNVVGGLESLFIERVDVTDARTNIVVTKQIDRPPNVLLDRQSVVVRIEIKPIECAAATAQGACSPTTMFVAPVFEGLPVGMAVEGGPYVVQVRLSGPFDRIAALRQGDVRVAIGLTNATLGVNAVTGVATAPTGIRVEGVEPINIRIVPSTTP